MNGRFLAGAALFTLVVAAVPVSLLVRRAEHGPVVHPLASGPAPDFTLTALDGTTVRLADLRGKPVLVNFWASWCVPCRDEFPVLKRAAERDHRDDGLMVLGVLFADIPADARRFAARQHAHWPLLVDPDGDVARAYHVTSIPQSFFVRPDGTIASQVYGALTRHEVDHQVARLLGRSIR